MASRDADALTKSSTALRIAHRARHRRHPAGRRVECAHRRPRRARTRDQAAWRTHRADRRRRACAPTRPTTINGLVRWTVQRGIAGLEAWAGTPGTVGGAIFGNAHFGGRLIGELVESVRLAALDGTTRDLSRGRNGIRLRSKPLAENRRSPAVGRVPRVLRRSGGASRRWPASRSRIERRRSRSTRRARAASFRIPTAADVPPDIPASAGALVDRAGLKGTACGDARVSHDARQLHRQRRARDGRRHSRA